MNPEAHFKHLVSYKKNLVSYKQVRMPETRCGSQGAARRKRVTDGVTKLRTSGRTHPLIEMLGRILKITEGRGGNLEWAREWK